MDYFKVCFVILNYCTSYETKICVQSIKKYINKESCEIIIVDNNSLDKSGELLMECYKDEDNIHIIINKENLGFAKGNNVGFGYAKEKLKSDFIILLNSDTYLIDDRFYHEVINGYKKHDYGVMGPKVFTPLKNTGKCNPQRLTMITKKEVQVSILETRLKLILNYLRLDNIYVTIRKKIKDSIKKEKGSDYEINEAYNKLMWNIQLHGCCLVFSPNYIKKFNGLDSRTFLYMEEELLQIRINKAGLKMLYNPNLHIYHTEEVSSIKTAGSQVKRRRIKYKRWLKSASIVREELK